MPKTVQNSVHNSIGIYPCTDYIFCKVIYNIVNEVDYVVPYTTKIITSQTLGYWAIIADLGTSSGGAPASLSDGSCPDV